LRIFQALEKLTAINIQVGGISAIAPAQRENLVRLGLKAMIAGTIAALMTACIAGMLA
jgi:CNT family concentrative nucleoside transporter